MEKMMIMTIMIKKIMDVENMEEMMITTTVIEEVEEITIIIETIA